MEKDELQRTEIEDAIIAKFSAIQLRDNGPNDPIIIDFDQWEDFLERCDDLLRYYKGYTDTVIGIEVVRVYADFMRYLRAAINNDKIDADQRFDFQDKFAEVEVWMDDIIAQGARNWEHLNSGNDDT
jgi:hypothetical protein